MRSEAIMAAVLRVSDTIHSEKKHFSFETDNYFQSQGCFMRRLSVCLILFLFPALLFAHTFYVTNTRDDGSEGSFRWASEMCDWYPQTCDTILFAIPERDPGYDPEIGVWTVQWDTLNYDGYWFRNPCVVIDGFSQREFIGRDTNPFGPEIELKGPAQYGYNVGGIDIHADDFIIRGLCINGLMHQIIDITGWPGDEIAERILITGCYLGCDPTGTRLSGGDGIGVVALDAHDIRIGGDEPEERNVISGYRNDGIHLGHCGTFQIINNIIGLDRTGTVDFHPDGFHPGICISHNLDIMGPSVIRDNTIAGDRLDNVEISFVSGDSATIFLFQNRIGIGLDDSPQPGAFNISVIAGKHHRINENIIAYAHTWFGIDLVNDTDYVTISRNSIFGCRQLGINLSNTAANPTGVDPIDGLYGPGVNEEIDACICDSVVNEDTHTTAYFTCMADCVIEVFIAEENGFHGWCALPGHEDVCSGKTYLGNAEEITQGPVFSRYRIDITPALPAGARLTSTATNQNGSTSEFGCTCIVPLSGNTEHGCRPEGFRLFPPSPNPSGPEITICYHVSESGDVTIEAYNVAGRRVAEIVGGYHNPGIYGIRWNRPGSGGYPLSEGAYVLRMVAKGYVETHPFTIIR